jgi:ribosomal protein L44E
MTDEPIAVEEEEPPKKKGKKKSQDLGYRTFARNCLVCGGYRAWKIDEGTRTGDSVTMKLACPGCDTHVTITEDFNQAYKRLG